LAWISDVKDAQFHLHASANASLKITSKGIEGADFSVKLEEDLHGLPPRVIKKNSVCKTKNKRKKAVILHCRFVNGGRLYKLGTMILSKV
jgi:hypothetical protein